MGSNRYLEAYAPDKGSVLTCSKEGCWDVWDTQARRRLCKLAGHNSKIESACYSPDGKSIVTGGTDGLLKVSDVETGARQRVLGKSENGILVTSFSPDGSLVYTIGYGTVDEVWDAQSGDRMWSLDRRTGTFVREPCSPDSRWLLLFMQDGTHRIVRATDGSCLTTYFFDGGSRTASWSPSSNQIALGGDQGELALLRIEFGQSLGKMLEEGS